MCDSLPNASFIGFTGMPVELTDKNTRAVFSDYIDVYDMTRAVEDGTTVKIFYESRIAIDLYKQIIALRLEWHSDDLMKGKIKVVMTGNSSDPQNGRLS